MTPPPTDRSRVRTGENAEVEALILPLAMTVIVAGPLLPFLARKVSRRACWKG